MSSGSVWVRVCDLASNKKTKQKAKTAVGEPWGFKSSVIEWVSGAPKALAPRTGGGVTLVCKWTQEDLESKVLFSYTVSSRAAQAVEDPEVTSPVMP